MPFVHILTHSNTHTRTHTKFHPNIAWWRRLCVAISKYISWMWVCISWAWIEWPVSKSGFQTHVTLSINYFQIVATKNWPICLHNGMISDGIIFCYKVFFLSFFLHIGFFLILYLFKVVQKLHLSFIGWISLY